MLAMLSIFGVFVAAIVGFIQLHHLAMLSESPVTFMADVFLIPFKVLPIAIFGGILHFIYNKIKYRSTALTTNVRESKINTRSAATKSYRSVSRVKPVIYSSPYGTKIILKS